MIKSILVVLTFLSSTTLFSQESNSKPFDFGFFLEANHSLLEVKGTKAKSVQLNAQPGFGLGISTDYNINDNLALSGRASLSFSSASVDLLNVDANVDQFLVYSTNLDFRLHGLYYFGKKANRPYLLFGPSIMLPLDDPNDDDVEFTNRTNVSIDLGIGFDKDFTYLRFAPELRYSYGLNDINSSPFLENLYVHRLTLTFNFKD